MENGSPILSESTNEHVYHCAKCGLCLDACPVYKELLVESASPRGKVQLAKHIIEGNLDITKNMSDILFSQCLLCGSCVAACPSGVKQTELFSGLRWRATERYGIPVVKKVILQVIANRSLMSSGAWFGKWVRKIFSNPWIESKIKAGNLPIDGIPPFNDKPFNEVFPERVEAVGEKKGQVLYFHGCATNYVLGDIGESVVSVLTRMGVDVLIPKGQSCCGLPIFLSGDRKTSMKCIEEALKIFARDDVDAVIVDCATCGSALRHEYPLILAELKALGENISETTIDKANLLSSKVKDVSEYIYEHMDWLPEIGKNGASVKVTYHDPCHLLKAQGVGEQPRGILKTIPDLNYVEMEGANTCCGGGGEFQIEFAKTSSMITDRKVKRVHDTGASVLATGCPGCNMTIGAHLDKKRGIKVLHPVQLLRLALDGEIGSLK